jgi:hypothetical protein
MAMSQTCRKRALLHGDESAALGDAGYQGVEKRPENVGKPVTWHLAMKRSKRKALPNNKLGRMTEKLEHLKASVRAKVEHPFHVIRTCSVIVKRGTAAWRRTQRNCLRCSDLPTWCWLAGALRSLKPELRPERRTAPGRPSIRPKNRCSAR